MFDIKLRNVKYLDIELNTSCNLQCEPCPYKEDHKEPKFMNILLLDEILDQLDDGVSVKFCQRGEPLLSSILIHGIKKAHEKGLRTVINTNGIYLDHFGKDLIKAGLSEVILSDYNIPKQHENACFFSALNQMYQSPLKFTIKTNNPDKWIGIANSIIEAKYYDYLDITEDHTPLPNWKCSQLFEKLVIDPDGMVRCCCGNINRQKDIGDVKIKPIKQIWESSVLNLFRNLHEEGKSHEIDMCRRCAYRRSFIP